MKTSRIVLLAGAALLAVGVTGVALAQPGPGRGGPGFAMGEAFARADHFTVIAPLADPASPLVAQAEALARAGYTNPPRH